MKKIVFLLCSIALIQVAWAQGRPAPVRNAPPQGMAPQFGAANRPGMPSFPGMPSVPGVPGSSAPDRGKIIGKIDDEYIYKNDDNKYVFDSTDPAEPVIAPAMAPSMPSAYTPPSRPVQQPSGKPNPFKPANKPG